MMGVSGFFLVNKGLGTAAALEMYSGDASTKKVRELKYRELVVNQTGPTRHAHVALCSHFLGEFQSHHSEYDSFASIHKRP